MKKILSTIILALPLYINAYQNQPIIVDKELFNKKEIILNNFNKEFVSKISLSNISIGYDELILYEGGQNRFLFSCSNINITTDEFMKAFLIALRSIPSFLVENYILNPTYILMGVDPNSPGSVLKFFYKMMSYGICAVKTGAYVVPYTTLTSYMQEYFEKEAVENKTEKEVTNVNAGESQSVSETSVEVEKVDDEDVGAKTVKYENYARMRDGMQKCVKDTMEWFNEITTGKINLLKILKLKENELNKSVCEMLEAKKENRLEAGLNEIQSYINKYNDILKNIGGKKVFVLHGPYTKTIDSKTIFSQEKIKNALQNNQTINTNYYYNHSNPSVANVIREKTNDVVLGMLYYSNCYLTNNITNNNLLKYVPDICQKNYKFTNLEDVELQKWYYKYINLENEKDVEKVKVDAGLKIYINNLDLFFQKQGLTQVIKKINYNESSMSNKEMIISSFNRISMLKEMCIYLKNNIYYENNSSSIVSYGFNSSQKEFIDLILNKKVDDLTNIEKQEIYKEIEQNFCSNEVKKILNVKERDLLKEIDKEELINFNRNAKWFIGESFINSKDDRYKDKRYCLPYTKDSNKDKLYVSVFDMKTKTIEEKELQNHEINLIVQTPNLIYETNKWKISKISFEKELNGEEINGCVMYFKTCSGESKNPTECNSTSKDIEEKIELGKIKEVIVPTEDVKSKSINDLKEYLKTTILNETRKYEKILKSNREIVEKIVNYYNNSIKEGF